MVRSSILFYTLVFIVLLNSVYSLPYTKENEDGTSGHGTIYYNKRWEYKLYFEIRLDLLTIFLSRSYTSDNGNDQETHVGAHDFVKRGANCKGACPGKYKNSFIHTFQNSLNSFHFFL